MVRFKSNSSDCRTFSLFLTLPFKEKLGFIATKKSSSSLMVLISRSCSFLTALVASVLSSSLGFAVESRTLCKKPCAKENLLAVAAEVDMFENQANHRFHFHINSRNCSLKSGMSIGQL